MDGMAKVERKVTRIGGSLGIIIPRDFAEAMNIEVGSKVELRLSGRELITTPGYASMSKAKLRRVAAEVLKKYAPAFKALAEHDQS
jgi:antitoxin component of MazEF toxin-antitoxin module